MPILRLALLLAVTTNAAFLSAQSPSERHFIDKVAPLLRDRCLECHDSEELAGELDLSRRVTALKGGENGAAIVAGKPDQSLLWKQIASDDMPQDRPPLAKEEKEIIRRWIEQGAVWPLESIARKRPEAIGVYVQRLTVPEYIASVRVAVGVDISDEAKRLLPRDLRADGFSNTAYNLGVDLSHVEAYAKLAQIAVEQIDASDFAQRYAKGDSLEEAHLRRVISSMGKWILRGPLNDREIEAYLSVAGAVKSEGGNYEETIAFTIESMLQSPRFLYRIERQQGEGESIEVGPYEMASRMSYIVWGAPPDEELMRAADAGELSRQEHIVAQVERMLRDPRAIIRSEQFLTGWLNLDRLDNLRPSQDRFPRWNERLANDMRDETLAFFREVAWNQRRPLSDLLNAQVTFATPRLAEHYNMPRPQGAATVGRRYERLEALYTFQEGNGEWVRDVSGRSKPLDLRIGTKSAVEWTDNGLTVTGKTLIAYVDNPHHLVNSLKATGEVSIEAWLIPANTKQDGPARIVTLSSGTSNRNFTLGQEGNRYDVRFRTSRQDRNGMPSLPAKGGSAKTELTHVVYTRDKNGNAKLYLNGNPHADRKVEGDLRNWDSTYQLALANETSGDRPWNGTLRMVALYSRPLPADEIKNYFDAGPYQPTSSQSRYDLADVPSRGGLLTQGSVLTIGGDEASMVTRGLFVLHDLLHGKVSDPPPCVDTTPVPTKPGVSQRKIAEARIANRSCGGCHEKFEPLAFGLERFDGLGTYLEQDKHGNSLRQDGEIRFPGTAESVSYQTSSELMDLLANSNRVKEGITRKLVQFALGRPIIETDEPTLNEINNTVGADGGTYQRLIAEIIASDLVMKARTESSKSGDRE